MFQDSLLIIKNDYIKKNKLIKHKLISAGFLIQGTRNIRFTPELAVEFLKLAGIAEDSHFVIEVHSLSKGYSEAIIVTKENAIEELWTLLVCYFGTTQRMEPNVYISKVPDIIRKDISYIFPNYVHEPVQLFDQHQFRQQPFIQPLIGEMYNIAQGDTCLWKQQLIEWLSLNNRNLPQVSNVCSTVTALRAQNKQQQTTITIPKDEPFVHHPPCKLPTVLSSSSKIGASSPITTTSCISCTSFDSTCSKPSSTREPYPVYPEMLTMSETGSEPRPSTPSTVEKETEEPETLDEEEYLCRETPPSEEEEVPEEPPEGIPIEQEECEPFEEQAEPDEPVVTDKPVEPEIPADEELTDLGDGEDHTIVGGTAEGEPLEGEPIPKDNESELAAAPADNLDAEHSEPAPAVETEHSEPAPVVEAEHSEPAPAVETEHSEPAPVVEAEHSEPAPAVETENPEPEPAAATENPEPEPAVEADPEPPTETEEAPAE